MAIHANITTAPTRRKFLGHLASTPALASLAATTAVSEATLIDNADAGLIALCGEFDALERQVLASFDEFDEDHDGEREIAVAPLQERQQALLELMSARPATTLAGLVAVARSLELWSPDFLSAIEHRGVDDRLASQIVRDLISMALRAQS
jgi:hypothetical protein